jgi:hypothetical protein
MNLPKGMVVVIDWWRVVHQKLKMNTTHNCACT